MKFKCQQENLLEGIQIVLKAVSMKSTLPILNGILFELEENQLTLSATDLELAIKYRVKTKEEVNGKMVAPARLIGDIVRNLPDEEIEFLLDEASNQASLTCQKAEFQIKTLPVEDFPKFPEESKGQKYELKTKDFIELIKKVSKAASIDESRPVLKGVLLKLAKDKLEAAATDSYRLAVGSIEIENGPDKEIKVIIPAHALNELIKTITPSSNKTKLVVTENQAIFESGQLTLSSRLIEGQFPDYKQLIPESYKGKLEVEREPLLSALRRVSLLAQNTPLKLDFRGQALRISAQTAEVGEAEEQLEAKYQGEAQEMAFNPQYLLDGVTSIDEQKALLETNDPLKPGLLRAEKEPFLYLIMPVRLS